MQRESEDATEPDGDALAVVVVPEDVGDHGVDQSKHDDRREKDIHRLVHAGGRREHRPDRPTAVDQDRHSHHGADPRHRTDADSHEVIGVFRDADELGPRARHAQTHDVTTEDEQDAEVEHRAAQAQQSALVELRRPCGPAELVVPVAPPVPDHEHGETDVGKDDPQEGVEAAGHAWAPLSAAALLPMFAPANVGVGNETGPLEPPPGCGMYSGGANGARPTSSAGGPCAASLMTASRSPPASGGSVALIA